MNINLKSSKTPLPILKFGKEVASRASTADADSFLSNPKKEQFWNASRLLAIRRFEPIRLSLQIKSSQWYFEDGISKFSGPRDSSCNMEAVKSRQLSIKAYWMCKMAVHISMIHKFMSVVLITSSWSRVHRSVSFAKMVLLLRCNYGGFQNMNQQALRKFLDLK